MHEASGEIYPNLSVDKPLSELNVIGTIHSVEDLDYLIEYINDVIEKSIPDFSEPAEIVNQQVLMGSNKSKISELLNGGRQNSGEEFMTSDLLQLCIEWKEFIRKKNQI